MPRHEVRRSSRTTRVSYTITEIVAGTFQVIDNRLGSPDGTDTLTDIELVRFSDGYYMLTPTLNVTGMQLQAPFTVLGTDTDTGGVGDTLTIGNTQTQSNINLQGGGVDTLNISVPGNYTTSLSNVEVLNGTAGMDGLTVTRMTDQAMSINLGDGANSLVLGSSPTALTTVTGGLDADLISASAGADIFRFTSAQDSGSEANARDVIQNFNADVDQLLFDDGASDLLATAINFIGSGTSADHPAFLQSGMPEARYVEQGGGVGVIEIDVDGDGTLSANDITIELRNFFGTLDSTDFVKGS